MLLLDSRSMVVDGVCVFPDHADEGVWYYQPTMPHLTTTTNPVTGQQDPSFLLLAYTGSEGAGGFLNFDVNVGLPADKLADIAQQIADAQNLRDTPRVVPVPLVGGTVKLQMLDGATDAPTPVVEGRPQFVLKIDHHTSPSLYGDNQAAFSVALDKAGFSVVNDCLNGAILPIAVVYSLDFLGLRPAYSVRVNVDWDRVQHHLDEKFSAKVLWFSTDISTAVDELVESRAIDIQADTFVTEGDENEGIISRRDLAIAQARQMITDAFFTPSLPPWTPEKKADWVQALETIGGLAAQGAAQAAGGPAASSASFSYSRTDYTRIDKKSLDAHFSERTTVKKTIYPQGHLGQVLSSIQASGRPIEDFVRRVNIDDPWFDRRRLAVSYMPGLAVDEIGHINVRATYGGVMKNAFLTAPDWKASFDWPNQLVGGAVQPQVDLGYEVTFKGVDAGERPGTVVGPTTPVVEDSVSLTPETTLFVVSPVTVRAENLPWTTYSSVDVELRYTDEANKIDQLDSVRLTQDKPDGLWRRFQLDLTRRAFQAHVVYRGLDQHDVDTGWKPVDAESVVVRDPFPSKRVLEVVPPVVWTELSRVFVDVRYADEANSLVVEDSFTFVEGGLPEKFVVDLHDPTKRDVFYTVTFQYKDGRTQTLPESVTADRRLVVDTAMQGRRLVRVLRPANFAALALKQITVELRFEDPLAGLSFADRVVLDAATAEGTFEFAYVDAQRDTYEVKTSFLFANGLSKGTDWTPATALELTPTPS